MPHDHLFRIGSSHQVCQDYAVSGPGYGVVSDGCSASEDSDFGSRLLCRLARHAIIETGDEVSVERICIAAEQMGRSLRLGSTFLDATLLSILKDEFGDYRVNTFGDGVVVARRHDGLLYEVSTLEFDSGAPAYPSYQIDPRRRADFLETFGAKFSVGYHELGNTPACTFHRWQSIAGEGLEGTHFFHKASEYAWVAVCSDGLRTFQRRVQTDTRKGYEDVPLAEVVRTLFDFERVTPGVLQRRLNVLTNFGQDVRHVDDLSIAVLQIDPPAQSSVAQTDKHTTSDPSDA